jgi:hypothetical protein
VGNDQLWQVAHVGMMGCSAMAGLLHALFTERLLSLAVLFIVFSRIFHGYCVSGWLRCADNTEENSRAQGAIIMY